MLDWHKIAVILSVLWIAAATMMAPARAEEAVFSDSERLGLATCLAKCRDGDKACPNRCISQAQTKWRMWADDVRACLRDCRGATDKILGCLTDCHIEQTFQ